MQYKNRLLLYFSSYMRILSKFNAYFMQNKCQEVHIDMMLCLQVKQKEKNGHTHSRQTTRHLSIVFLVFRRKKQKKNIRINMKCHRRRPTHLQKDIPDTQVHSFKITFVDTSKHMCVLPETFLYRVETIVERKKEVVST